jgi:hypothetical protein
MTPCRPTHAPFAASLRHLHRPLWRLDRLDALLDLLRIPQLDLCNPDLLSLKLLPVRRRRLILIDVGHEPNDERLHPRRDEVAEKTERRPGCGRLDVDDLEAFSTNDGRDKTAALPVLPADLAVARPELGSAPGSGSDDAVRLRVLVPRVAARGGGERGLGEAGVDVAVVGLDDFRFDDDRGEVARVDAFDDTSDKVGLWRKGSD